MIDYTLVVAVDDRTSGQLKAVWPTWVRHRPCLLNRPMMVICDGQIGQQEWESRLTWLEHPDRQIVVFDCPWPDVTQRERMLTAWVKVPPQIVETEYWLKIDTDAVATSPKEWVSDELFKDLPALVANPWGYTKPAWWLHLLDSWAMSVPDLADGPALNLPRPEPDQETISCPRIAGWLSFIRTDFSQRVLKYVPDKLPVPSQDTYHWYCALRLGEPIVKRRFRKFGWDCVYSDKRRQKVITEALL